MIIVGWKMEIHGWMGSQCLNIGISVELEVESNSMLKWCVIMGSISMQPSELIRPRYGPWVAWTCISPLWGRDKAYGWWQGPTTHCMVLLLSLAEDEGHPCSTPSSMSSLKMSFIIIWNVARLFMRLSNMTRGLNRPQFIQKAVFHSSPSLIHTLLYPQWMSSFLTYLALIELQLISTLTLLSCHLRNNHRLIIVVWRWPWVGLSGRDWSSVMATPWQFNSY